MSDLIYDRSINKLSWPAKGKDWSAVSGIAGQYEMLPPGEYWVKRNHITQYTKYTESPYKPRKSSCPLLRTNNTLNLREKIAKFRLTVRVSTPAP